MRKLFLAIPLILFSLQTLLAQQEDFHTWYNLTVNGNIFKKVDFSIEPEIRLFENSSQLRSWQSELNISVPIVKKIDIGGIYRYQVEYDNPEKNKRVHRWALYTKIKYKSGKLRWNYRAQIQNEQANYRTSKNGSIHHIGHRHKLSLKYKNKKWFVYPSFGFEYYFSLSPAVDDGEWKNRFFISMEKEINKRLSGKLSYKYQNEFNIANPDVINIFYMGIEYSPKFLKIRKKKIQ
ncbi:DUF2490 domain-containing protein [Labilibacter sediminis]|nr:DUF2490 domain-containing protein [Labilibacter sediminis]